jgi:hypothetical protein
MKFYPDGAEGSDPENDKSETRPQFQILSMTKPVELSSFWSSDIYYEAFLLSK